MPKVAIVAALLLAISSIGTGAAGHNLHLGPDARTDVGLTVYSDFALVRDVRETTLPTGYVELEYEDVARTIDPSSVRVRTRGGGAGIDVVRQSYQYDLLNKQSLLGRYIGRKLKYSRSVLRDNNTYEKVLREGLLLSIDPEIVQFGDEIEISPEGVISLPYVPEGLKTIPTLVWELDNERRGPQEIETTYLADGIGWSAEYMMVLNGAETRFDLSSWINLTNESGTSFDDASLKLVAGEVRREQASGEPRPMMARAELAADASSQATRERLSDYHLYEFPDPVSIAEKEQVQLSFLSAGNVAIDKRYVSVANVPMHQMREPQSERFDIRLEFDNSSAGSLGEPLPAGRVRVAKADGGGDLQLLGEDRIDHTPIGDAVELVIGKAFDLGIERTQKAWRRIGERVAEVTVEVEVTNSKREDARLILHEKFYGDWEVVSQTQSGEKIDSTTLEYDITLGGGKSRTFSYTVRSNF